MDQPAAEAATEAADAPLTPLRMPAGHAVAWVLGGVAAIAAARTLAVLLLDRLAASGTAVLPPETGAIELLRLAYASEAWIWVTPLVATLPTLAIVLYFACRPRGGMVGFLALRFVGLKPAWKQIGDWIIAVAALGALSAAMTWAFGLHPPSKADLGALAAHLPGPKMALFALSVVVAVPLAEEMVFRGFLYRIARGHVGRWTAAALVAAVWAALHTQYDWLDAGRLFAFGLLFGAARIRTGSVLVPWAMHAYMNLGAVIYMLKTAGT